MEDVPKLASLCIMIMMLRILTKLKMHWNVMTWWHHMIVCRLLGCLLGTRMSPGFLKVLAMRFQMLDAHGQGVYCMHVLFLVDKGTLSTEVKDCKVCEVLPGSNKHVWRTLQVGFVYQGPKERVNGLAVSLRDTVQWQIQGPQSTQR